jgi:pyruvate kinase
MTRTKIIATIGPAVATREKLAELIDAGINVARLNMSHGGTTDKEEWIRWIREIATERERPVAILVDLCGPKIRAGKFAEGSVRLEPGATFTITNRKVTGDATIVGTTYDALPRDVEPGQHILLDDGHIELEVVKTDGTDVETRVIVGGILKDSKGINLPGVKVSTPALTPKDLSDLEWAIGQDVDFVAISFVRTAADVAAAKRIIKAANRRTPVIAKIEKPEAIDNLESIIDLANGVMVARGDLGVEVGPEKVPVLQKRIIELANRKGVTVITATQMLESMIQNPRPTRAEASDVANAIFDRTDAVMLSGETAAGKYPVETVKMMVRIIEDAEAQIPDNGPMTTMLVESDHPNVSILARSARNMADAVDARCIAVFTESGRSARLVSKYRPREEILGLTPRIEAYRRMALHWGVTPRLIAKTWNYDQMLGQMDAVLLSSGAVKRGETIVILFSTTPGISGTTDSLRIGRVGEIEKGWAYRTDVPGENP